MMKINKISIFCIVIAAFAMVAMATMEADEKDCADQLTNLASCIPYVSGTAKKPTPECCEETKKVKAAKPKCLCVLIKESTDPSLGLPINTTLAIEMPSQCSIEGKLSDCLAILNLPADSPDAKIFKSVDDSTTTTTDSPSTSSSASSSTTPSATSGGSSASDSKTTTKILVIFTIVALSGDLWPVFAAMNRIFPRDCTLLLCSNCYRSTFTKV